MHQRRIEFGKWWLELDRILHSSSSESHQWHKTFPIVVLFGGGVGASMGSFLWVTRQKGLSECWQQMFYSGIKVPLLLAATFVISVPSFYVINSLLGLSSDFSKAINHIVLSQATMCIVLLSLMPLVMLYYFSCGTSSTEYRLAVLLNTVCFAISSIAAQFNLRRIYQPLIARNPSHRKMIWVWSFVYAMVGIQMAWVFRPFVGSPNQTTTFFRKESWDNAYLKMLEIVCGVF